MNGSVPPFTFVTVPSTPWPGFFAFALPVVPTVVVEPATPLLACVLVPATPLVVFGLDETFVVLDALTFELVFTDELTLVEELVWTDEPVETDVVVLHAAVPVLSAWTSGACFEPGHATLCGWLLPGP